MSRPLCKCGNVKEIQCRVNGVARYRSSCSSCRKLARATKGTNCERCGFIPESQVQLDVDHIDGNKSNNDPNNLQTLYNFYIDLSAKYGIKMPQIIVSKEIN